MRKSILLAMLLAAPGLLTAQVPQTDSKPPSKPRTPSAGKQGSNESAFDRARVAQKDADRVAGDESEEPADAPEEEPTQEPEADGPKVPLAAKLFVTHQPAAFMKAWKAGETALPTTGIISQANPVMTMVAVSGCARGKDGKCAVEFTSRTAGPDGLFDKPRTSPPWKPAPMRGKPELAPASFGLRLGPGDPPGRYTIEVKVTDTVAKTSRTLTGMVTKPAAEGGR